MRHGCGAELFRSSDGRFHTNSPGWNACEFELQIDGSGGKQIQRDFFDTDGNLVRTLGRNGLGAHITSLGTEATLALPQSTGAVSHVRRSRLDADG